MKQLFTRVFALLILLFTGMQKEAAAQTVFETVSSGDWSDANIWRSWVSGTIGVGSSTSPALNAPVGTNKVVIHNTHTVTLGSANRNCHGLLIESGGKLWMGSSTPRRLSVGVGGSGFLYPVTDSLVNNGILGGTGDGLYVETGANTANLTITGTGTFDILRLRTPGGSGASANGVLNVIIDADINIYQVGNYGLSVVYSPALTDNYTMTINKGKTVTIKDATGFFHNSDGTDQYGKYTYVIKGTLDVSANTQSTSNISSYIQVPTPAASSVTLTVDGGTFKLGKEFKADTVSTSTGTLTLQAINGGLFNASNTTKLTLGKTTDGASGVRDLFFGLDATSKLSQTVGANEVKFPVGLSTATTPNNAYITNAGTSDVFSIGIKNSFDQPLSDASKVVTRQWDISEAINGGSDATIKLSWLTADMPGGFNPAGPVNIIHYLSGWTEVPASITGSGSTVAPYISAASGFTSFSPFGVDNSSGVVPVTFVNVKAYQTSNGVQVDWSNATEQDVRSYTVERSVDGVNYTSLITIPAKTNNGGSNNYSSPDVSPNDGVNLYRIKATENNGNIKYSSVANVDLGKGNSGIAIYPNPVKDGIVNLQLTAMDKGTYNVTLLNLAGQKLATNSVVNAGGSTTQQLSFDNILGKGIYILEIIAPNGSKTSLKLIGQ